MKSAVVSSKIMFGIHRMMHASESLVARSVMQKAKLLIFTSALVACLASLDTSTLASVENECKGSPLDAVMILPSPLRKWGEIVCTPFGHELRSRDGWIWASLDDGKSVRVPSQMVVRNPAPIGNQSYFADIQVQELPEADTVLALATFSEDLPLDEMSAKAYRGTLTSVSGGEITLYFFDFGDFAGAMWCPDESCVSSSRFLIMKDGRENSQPPSI